MARGKSSIPAAVITSSGADQNQITQVKHILITSLSDVLSFTVLDYNTRTKDTELGVATFDLEKLKADATLEGLSANILDAGRVRGELRFDA